MKKILSSLFLCISLSASADIEKTEFPIYMEDISMFEIDGKYYAIYKDFEEIQVDKNIFDYYNICKRTGNSLAMYAKIVYYPGYRCLTIKLD